MLPPFQKQKGGTKSAASPPFASQKGGQSLSKPLAKIEKIFCRLVNSQWGFAFIISHSSDDSTLLKFSSQLLFQSSDELHTILRFFSLFLNHNEP